MSRIKPETYLQMWLSEQISTNEWLRILKERVDVKLVYNKYKNGKNNV